MKILLLHPNFIWKYNNGHQRFRNEIAKAHDVIFVGEGFNKERKLVYKVPDLVDKYKPDVLMTYSCKYTTPFKQINKVTSIPKVHFIDDLVPAVGVYRGYIKPYIRMLLDHNYDLCFGRSVRVVDYVLKNSLARQCEFLPFSIDTLHYRDLEAPRDIIVSAPMSIVPDVYPNRQAVLSQIEKLRIKHNTHRLFGKEYLKLLNRSLMTVNSVNIWKAVNFKILEAMACGALVLTDHPTDLPLLGIKDREHLIVYNSVSELSSLITKLMKNPFEIRIIADNGMKFVRKYHSNKARVRYLTELMEAKL